MFKKNNNVIKMNGGGYYYRLSQILKVFLIMLFFAINVFAEIPHSYVTENPNKEVTQIETLKRKDKAELNLTITKKNSKEAKVERAFYNTSTGLFYIVINGKEYNIAPDDNLLISNKLEELPNLSTTNGRKKINKMFNTREVNYKMESNGNWRNIQTTFEELPKEVYINVLDRNYNLKDVLNLKDIKITRASDIFVETEIYADIYEGYQGDFFNGKFIKNLGVQDSKNKYIKYNASNIISWNSNFENQQFFLYDDDILKEFGVNEKIEVYETNTYPEKNYIINDELVIKTYSFKDYGNSLWFHFVSFPRKDFSFKVEEKKQRPYINNEINKRTYYFTYKKIFLKGESILSIDSLYKNEYIKFNSCTIDNLQPISLIENISGVTINTISGTGLLTLEQGDILSVNGQQNTINYGTLVDQNLTLNGINLSYKVENGKLQLRVNNYDMGIDQAQPLNLKVNRSGQEVMNHTMFIAVPNIQVISGESILEVKEYYSSPEYIYFNSFAISNPKPIEIENSLADVKVVQNSGNGLVNLENGDILELNGKEYHIEAGGNLSEQQDTLGEINFKFKVENGKLRLALISWGVLEPDRTLIINVNRKNNKLLNHKMIIKAPRRVAGISNLTFTEKYPLGEFVRFQGISLTAPTDGSLENPTPPGVTYKTVDGYGIPFMKDGDILEVQYNTMRDIKRYIIDSKNSLKHQTIDLPGIVLLLSVENGKLRLGLNKWTANKNAVLTLKIIRGVNEISSTNLTLEVPKAQFDILKGGILDFGQLIQGSKNIKAETDILLQMHQDISEVNMNLSTTTPELVNSNGAILHARDLQVDVQNQENRRYLVIIKGKLDISEQQELGAYKGSALLNVEIK